MHPDLFEQIKADLERSIAQMFETPPAHSSVWYFGYRERLLLGLSTPPRTVIQTVLYEDHYGSSIEPADQTMVDTIRANSNG